MSTRRARWAIVIGAAAAATGLMLACSSSDDTVAGKVDPTGPNSGQDATAGSDVQDQPDTLLPPGAPLCKKYPNGPAMVAKITSDLLNAIGADCRISAYFVAPKSGAAHLSQCLESQIATFFQCDGATYGNDQAGKACRSMSEAHKDLGLRTADFDAFIANLVTVMKANGISNDDITAVLPTFTGTKSAIVPNAKGLGNSQCTCPNDITPDGGYCGLDAGVDAGGDASDAGDGATGIADASDAG